MTTPELALAEQMFEALCSSTHNALAYSFMHGEPFKVLGWISLPAVYLLERCLRRLHQINEDLPTKDPTKIIFANVKLKVVKSPHAFFLIKTDP